MTTYVVQFESHVKLPVKLIAKHNGRAYGANVHFDTRAQHKAFMAELQARVNALCERKGIPAFSITG